MKPPKIKQGFSKYRAIKREIDNIIFDSKAEAARYQILKILEKSGHIKDLKLQVPFNYYVNDKKIFTYYADFTYKIVNNSNIIEDVKGVKTPVYRLKKKLIEAYYGIKITEVK